MTMMKTIAMLKQLISYYWCAFFCKIVLHFSVLTLLIWSFGDNSSHHHISFPEELDVSEILFLKNWILRNLKFSRFPMQFICGATQYSS